MAFSILTEENSSVIIICKCTDKHRRTLAPLAKTAFFDWIGWGEAVVSFRIWNARQDWVLSQGLFE